MTNNVSIFSRLIDRMIKDGKFNFILRFPRGMGPSWRHVFAKNFRFDNRYSDIKKPLPAPMFFSYRESLLGRVFDHEPVGVLKRSASELCMVAG